MSVITLPTHYYQQFGGDLSLEYPAEAYGGWQTAELPLNLSHTAVVVMHAAYCGSKEEIPNWFGCVDYIPRSYEIAENIIPPILDAARRAGVKIIHIPMDLYTAEKCPGYAPVRDLCPEQPVFKPAIITDETVTELQNFRFAHVWPGEAAAADMTSRRGKRDFCDAVRPVGDEPVAVNSPQLAAWCEKEGINHLIYTGFAINMCLSVSPGGMVDMSRYGLICSTIREATTAVENKETIRTELMKELQFWRVSLSHGFVYGAEDFKKALNEYADQQQK